MEGSAVRRVLGWVFLVLGVAFGAAQLYRPDMSNPSADKSKDVSADLGPDSAIAPLLRRACYDCHSSETRWPWYSSIAPASWLVASDVHGARHHLNFSLWGDYSVHKKLGALDHIREEISSGDMPPSTYAFMHPGALLDSGERDTILVWTEKELRAAGEQPSSGKPADGN